MSRRMTPAILTLAGFAALSTLGGGVLTWYVVDQMVNFTPSCTPSLEVSCREYVSGRDAGPATVDEQHFDFMFGAGLVLIVGAVTLVSGLMMAVAVARLIRNS